MDDDQQFCLRWNNHQSTLISVFDTLLENGTLVDCTLAAEGKFLKAHKVVLSACSPYFAALLSQQYDKHPIFILKDVKFQELRAMMDYMYRGEVNISQDQLAALLKAAESLQIKGLSDSRGNSTQNKDTAKPPPASAKASELKIENKRPMRSLGPELDTDIGSREGSTSPTSRKRKKIRRRSIDTNNVDNHDQLSNSSSHSMPHNVNTSLANQTQPHTNQISTTSSSATTNLQTPVTKKTEQQQKPESHNQHNKAESNNDETNDNDDDSENDNDVPPQPQKRVKESSGKEASNNADLLLEPKNEYDDDDGQPVEDLTLDDEELLEEDMDEAGPSHGGGEGSSQGGYAQWQMERSQDEAFMAAQEAGGQHRDAQGLPSLDLMLPQQQPSIRMAGGLYSPGTASVTSKLGRPKKGNDSSTDHQQQQPMQVYNCQMCGKGYTAKGSLVRHNRYECAFTTMALNFACPYCNHKSRRKDHLKCHILTHMKQFQGTDFVMMNKDKKY